MSVLNFVLNASANPKCQHSPRQTPGKYFEVVKVLPGAKFFCKSTILGQENTYPGEVLGQNLPGQTPPDKIPLDKIPPDKTPLDKIPPLYPPNCSIAQYFLLYRNVIFEGQFSPPLLDVIRSMVMKWRSVAERSR